MAEPIRIYCDDPDYTDTWIDIAPRWSTEEHERMLTVVNDDFWAFLRSKTVACHIQTVDDGAVTDPAQLSAEGLRVVDVLLWSWLEAVMPLAVAKRRVLGKGLARLSSPANATATTTATTAAPTTTPTT